MSTRGHATWPARSSPSDAPATDAVTLAGVYRDTIDDGRGTRWESSWRSNRIVSTAWPLMAALLRNEPGVRGILHCAFGEGDASWDTVPPRATVDTSRLHHELQRVAIDKDKIEYVDAIGQVALAPTHRLELSVTLVASAAPLRLREFGLVGGEATGARGTGRLINYVIHPRVDLPRGASLTRRVRLSFRTGGAGLSDGPEIAHHWLADVPVHIVDGVGDAIARTLRARKITTLGELAAMDVAHRPEGMSAALAITLRAKARLALRTAARPTPIAGLGEWTLARLLTATAGALPASVPPAAMEALQERLALLHVTLDASFLARTMLDALDAPER